MTHRNAVWILILLGSAIRIGFAIVSPVSFDMQGFHQAGRGIWHWGLHFYDYDQPGTRFSPLPYPPGFLPWLALISGAGHSFAFLERLPMICADAAIAWLVQRRLSRAGVAAGARLFAVALIALSPSMIVAAGRGGQFDSVAILPVLIACLTWEAGGPRRAIRAGVLIGLGAAIKTVPIVGLVALLPTVRSRKEAATLVAAAVAVPLVALAPFLAAGSSGVIAALGYHGLPGGGGISLLVDPSGSTTGAPALQHLTTPMILTALAIVGLALRRYRVPAAASMTVVWLAVYISGADWFAHYAVWGIPFFVMSGALWFAAAFQALLACAWVLDPSHHLALLHDIRPDLQHILFIAIWAVIVAVWVVTLALALLANRVGVKTGGRLKMVSLPAPPG